MVFWLLVSAPADEGGDAGGTEASPNILSQKVRSCGRKGSVGLPAAGVNAAEPVRAGLGSERVFRHARSDLHTSVYMQVALRFRLLIKSSAELGCLLCLYFFSKVIFFYS